MARFMFNIVDDGESRFYTVFFPGHDPLVASDQHPNSLAISDYLLDSDGIGEYEEAASLFDVEQAVAQRFTRLSDRVAIAHGQVYFDGDVVDDSLTKQIVRFLDEGVSDWQPLVRFMENIASNPQEFSRTQLFDWLNARDFTITSQGNIVAYKGVHKRPDGSLVSGWTGTARVDGVLVKGNIPNTVGSIVEMPRSEVAFDPATACSTGLHVGTYEYAEGYSRGAMLRVHVNPRDVVSVPTDAAGEKVRVCRYSVEEVIDAPLCIAIFDESVEEVDECWCGDPDCSYAQDES